MIKHFLPFNVNWLFYSMIARPWQTLNAQWITNLSSRWSSYNNAAWTLFVQMGVFQTISCWSRQFLLRDWGARCLWQFLMRWSTLWLMLSVWRTSLLQFLFYRENSESCRFVKLVISFFARLCADDKTKYASHVCSLWNGWTPSMSASGYNIINFKSINRYVFACVSTFFAYKFVVGH